MARVFRKSEITLAMVEAFLHYEVATGELVWKWRHDDKRWSSTYGGMRAGTLRSGYLRVRLFGLRLPAHHIVWFLHHGTWPLDQLDHKDGDRANNAIENLREATTSTNAQNRKRRATNRSGHTGIWKQKNRWRAEVAVRGFRSYLGMFRTKKAARKAYLREKKRLHEFQPVPRVGA